MLWAKGAEKQIRGDHPDIAIGDDLESDEMVISSDRCKKFDNWFWTAFMGMNPEQVILVGTILHPESFLAQMINHPRHGWNSRIYQAITPEGAALWPDKWPLPVLRDIEKERGTYYFQQEYMNNPIPDNLRIFQESWFKTYERLPEGLVYFTTVDPAISLEDTADYTAVVTCGVDSDRNIYVAEYTNKRMLPDEAVDAIFSANVRYKPPIIAIESQGFQRMLKHDFKQECVKRHEYPIIKELKSDGRRKALRIEGLQPFFQSGKVYMREEHAELRTQLLRFPSSRCKDDIIDALAYQLDIIRPAEDRVEQINPDSVYARIMERKRNISNGPNKYYGNFPF
jgi:predicted phage terminase large subunit-like protein